MDKKDKKMVLYNEHNEAVYEVQLSDEGFSAYLAGKEWDSSWIETIVDLKTMKKAEL